MRRAALILFCIRMLPVWRWRCGYWAWGTLSAAWRSEP